MKYEIGYNSQRDNFNFNGAFSGYSQCFSTSAWMLMSYFCPAGINVADDIGLAAYIRDVDTAVNADARVAKSIQDNDHTITGHTSLYWEVQKAGIQMWLSNRKINGQAITEYNASYDRMKQLIDKGPVIIGTDKMAGLPGGHIILGIGKDDANTIVNDPFGNAVLAYSVSDGSGCEYPDIFLSKVFTNKILYWKS